MVRRRALRTGLLLSNFVVLAIILAFVLQNPQPKTVSVSVLANTVGATAAAHPVDQLASANIAVTVSRMTSLPETNAVNSQANSQNVELALLATEQSVIPKPQIVATKLKSRADIQSYVVIPGDSVSSIANKFSVTSSSIRWSNNLNGDYVTVGTKLAIPPVNGIVYTVKSGDTADILARRYSAQKDQVIAYNDAEISGLKTGEQIIIPNATVATANYGYSAWGSYAVYGSNGYDPGWCTWYVANRRAQLGEPVPSTLGNAYSWYEAALLAPLPTGVTPAVGAVMVNKSHNHVAVVEQVNPDGSFWVSEMNSYGQVSITDTTPTGGLFMVDYKLFTSVSGLKFIY